MVALLEPLSDSFWSAGRAVEMKGAVMVQPHLTPVGERIVEPMIELARCSKLDRIIVAGACAAHMFELHRRGYVRVATTTNCGLPTGQYDVALVDWRGRSIKALDTTLDWLIDFLTPAGGLVVWIDPQEPAGNRKLRSPIEAGTVRERGCAVSAQRADMKAISNVA